LVFDFIMSLPHKFPAGVHGYEHSKYIYLIFLILTNLVKILNLNAHKKIF